MSPRHINKSIWVILPAVLAIQSEVMGQESISNAWYKISPEIIVKVPDKGLEIRWRPIDYTIPFQNWRSDLMVGKRLSSFKAFIYYKGDRALDKNRTRQWLGGRIDYNGSWMNKKLNFNAQYRYFHGLNAISVNHHQVVQFLDYRLFRILSAGALGFGRKNQRADPVYFMGPMVKFWWTRRFETIFAFTRDTLISKQYFCFLRFRFIFRRKQNN